MLLDCPCRRCRCSFHPLKHLPSYLQIPRFHVSYGHSRRNRRWFSKVRRGYPRKGHKNTFAYPTASRRTARNLLPLINIVQFGLLIRFLPALIGAFCTVSLHSALLLDKHI